MLTAPRSSLWLAALALAGPPVNSEDWPGLLGPRRDGTSSETQLAEDWLQHGIQTCWRRPVGGGYSGLAVSRGLLFSMDSDGPDEFVFAATAEGGRQKWRVRLGPSPRDVYGGLGPRGTPTVDGDSVLVTTAAGDLLSMDTRSGKLRWRRKLASELGWRPPAEGTASSPQVIGDRIFVLIGGGAGRAAAALDRATGQTIWVAQDGRTSYSSPLYTELAGQPQVLFLMARRLLSLAPGDGMLLWSHPWDTYDGVNVAVPLVTRSNRVFISAGYDQGAALLEIGGSGGSFRVTEVWRNREMKNHFNNSVFHEGVFYGFDNSILKAIDAGNGETLWRERGFGKGSLVRAGNYLIVLSERGELALIEANRDSCRVRARTQVLSGRCWTPPSIAGERIFLRNQKEMVCLQPIRE